MLQRKTSQLSFPLQAADRFTKRHEKSVIYLLTYLLTSFCKRDDDSMVIGLPVTMKNKFYLRVIIQIEWQNFAFSPSVVNINIFL